MMADFEAALVHLSGEVARKVNHPLHAVRQRFQDCHGCACDAHYKRRNEDMARLKVNHRLLDEALEQFHEACWVARGPTRWRWVNQIVEAGQLFLQGKGDQARLVALIDQALGEFAGRADRPPPACKLMDLLERLRASVSSSDLSAELQALPSVVDSAAAWIEEGPAQGLSQLLRMLGSETDPAQILPLVSSVLVDVAFEQERFDDPGILETLTELKLTLEALAEDLHGRWEWDFQPQLAELQIQLEARMERWHRSQTEQAVSCPACQQQNPPHFRRCRVCQTILPELFTFEAESADRSEDSETVRHFRKICQAYHEGSLGDDAFQQHMLELQERAGRARQGVGPDQAAFLESLEHIEEALQGMRALESNRDPALFDHAELFLVGAELMGRLQAREAGN